MALPRTATTGTIRRASRPPLGLPELRFSNMHWGGGGGGGSAAVGNAAAAIAAGYANCVVVFRSLAQGQFGRFGAGPRRAAVAGEAALSLPYGLMSPAQSFAMRAQRLMHEFGIKQEAPPGRLPRLVLPRAAEPPRGHAREAAHGGVVRELPLDCRAFHLYDCLPRERRAAALILVPAEPRPRLAPEAGVPARRRPGLPAPGRRGFPQQPGLRDGKLQDPGTTTLRDGEGAPRRRGRGAELRELHGRRGDEPDRTRLLQAGRGERGPPVRGISGRPTGACR